MRLCGSYCSHGGRCVKDAPHEGELHDSAYCTWSDAEALTKDAADAVLRTKPAGAAYLDTFGGFEEMLDGMDEIE